MKRNIISKLVYVLIILLLFNFVVIDNSVLAANVDFTLTDAHISNASSIAGDKNFFIATNPSHVWLFIAEEVNATFVVSNSYIRATSGGILYYYLPTPSDIVFRANTVSSSVGPVTSFTFYYSTSDILNTDGSIFFNGTNTNNKPYIANSQEGLANLDIDNLLINPGDFMDDLKFILYDYASGNKIFEINLSDYSDYIEREDDDNPFSDLIYVIPVTDLPVFSVENGKTYNWALVYPENQQVDFIVTSNVSKSVGSTEPPSAEDTRHEEIKDAISSSTDKIVESNKELQNSIDNQTQAIEENNKTNKNIFEKIGEILSFLNPFSENFFAYKLVELIVNALKSLFVPSEDFFTNWLDDLNTYFGETFGILYFPFQILIDFLNRISSISNTNTAIISVPEFNLSFMGYSVTIFQNMSFDMNTILENSTFKTLHDVYLVFTDVILWLYVVYLASKMINTVIGGMGDAVADNIEDSQAEERSYEKYSQYRANKDRYNKEHGGK